MAWQGWVKKHRKVMDSAIWADPYKYKLFDMLVMMANHDNGRVVFNGKEVPVSSGQLVTGRDALAFLYNKGAKPVHQKSSRLLWKWIQQFQNDGMLTIKSTTKYSVISITNYGRYQQVDQQRSSKGPATVQLESTNKNVKNEQEKTTTTPTGAVPALSFYEQNFGVMPPILQQNISDWVGDFEEIGSTNDQANQILVKAMQIALERNNRSFGYVKGILRDWEGKKLTTVAAVEGEEAKFKQIKQANKRGGGRRNPEPPPTGYEFTDDDLPF